MGLGSVKGRKFILSPKIKGHVQGICALYGTLVRVLLICSILKMFLVKPVVVVVVIG
jgi:hypothetical protein